MFETLNFLKLFLLRFLKKDVEIRKLSIRVEKERYILTITSPSFLSREDFMGRSFVQNIRLCILVYRPIFILGTFGSLNHLCELEISSLVSITIISS